VREGASIHSDRGLSFFAPGAPSLSHAIRRRADPSPARESISEIPLLALGLQASLAGPTGASPAADPRKTRDGLKISFSADRSPHPAPGAVMAQLPPMAIMDFVQRFQALQLQRDTGNELIKVGPGCRAPAAEDVVVTSLGSFDLLRGHGNRSAT
jgi:hypothetical protein